MHNRSRIADCGLMVAGTEVRQDQAMVSMRAAESRDPSRYRCPAEIDLDRTNPRDHVAFNFGLRTCIVAGLACLEIQDTVRISLGRAPADAAEITPRAA